MSINEIENQFNERFLCSVNDGPLSDKELAGDKINVPKNIGKGIKKEVNNDE